MSKAQILQEIRDERERQDQQWGGRTHDDNHSYADWIDYMEHQASLLDLRIGGNARERFIKIAALALAAVESIDRKVKP